MREETDVRRKDGRSFQLEGTRRGRVARLALVLACGLWLAAPATAQTGTIEGVVKDAGGKPAAEARVTLQEMSGAASRVAKTDAQGRFKISRLRRGIYQVRATLGSLRTGWKKDLLLRDGATLRVTLELPAEKKEEKQVAPAQKPGPDQPPTEKRPEETNEDDPVLRSRY